MTVAAPVPDTAGVEGTLAALRERLARTEPADARLRVMLVLAHEALRQRAAAAAALEAAGLGAEPREAAGQEPVDPEDYERLVARINEIAARVVPSHARALVVSRGDEELLAFAERAAHFPQGPNGVYAGHYPADGSAAIAHLEHCIEAGGGEFFLLPATSYWWLDYYGELTQHLLTRGLVIHHDEACLIIDLRKREEREPV
jgi:hypothetical protein